MTHQSSKASFYRTHSSKTTQLRRLSLVLLGLTASVGMGTFQAQGAIADPNSSFSTAIHLLAQASTTTTNNAEQAAALLQNYYQAINAHDYEQAYASWDNQGQASRQSLAEFSRGYANTKSVVVEITGTGRTEGAAGSSYVTLPVTLTVTTTSGQTQRFGGTYVLRKINDEVRTPVADRGWRIYSADIAQLTGARPTPSPSGAKASSMLSSYSRANTPLLQNGSRGQAVKDIQSELKVLKLYSSNVDGDFGPMTRQAVVQFQRQHRLTADGVVGPATWAALIGA